ncbi:uncharacterized protein LOC132062764 [Lycium ferocissimum]|uniref:uncharacterized protein LOC132062764 n=1 Tax=Lycium ferocissimum TaxID=112874 RepID=UPI0028157EA2|nr:uncharacterized protein LOC132062764 [Lycium ferocissimum]
MEEDAKAFVCKCDKCQQNAQMLHQSCEELHPMISPWPFMKRGMKIVRPLPVGPGLVRFVLMVTDYFSKWVEAAAYQKVREKEEITCDNSPEFIWSKVTKFLKDLNIKRINSSPYHPNGNGQVESTNKTVIQNLKKKLENAKGAWPSKLSEVLWAYRTTMKSSTRETPFSQVYGVEALIPVEVGAPSSRCVRPQEQPNTEAMLMQLDLLEEHRDLTYVRMVAQKQLMECYYNHRANLRHFKIRDLERLYLKEQLAFSAAIKFFAGNFPTSAMAVVAVA